MECTLKQFDHSRLDLRSSFRAREPHLGYARTVWDPWMDKHLRQKEAVQRPAIGTIRKKNCWERTPATVTNLLNDLDWPPLQDRRKIAGLTLFHKVVH